jgi:hypothetical protein
LQAARADADLVRCVSGDERAFSLPSSSEALEELVLRSSARLVVIDPIIDFLDDGVSDFNEQDVRRVLYALEQIAQRQRCAVLVVKHVNKRPGRRARNRLSGSIAWRACARNGLLFGRDREEPNGRVLVHDVCSFAETAGSIALEFETVLLEARDGEPELTIGRLRETGASDLTTDDLLGDDEDDGRETATDRVEKCLADEPGLTYEEIEERTGHSRATVERALAELDAEKDGGTKGNPARWSLPGAPSPSSSEHEREEEQTRMGASVIPPHEPDEGESARGDDGEADELDDERDDDPPRARRRLPDPIPF